jgi:hypothetical protein
MMQRKNREYFLTRAAELELAASAAPTPAISEGYRELARTFRELANEAAVSDGPETAATDRTRRPPGMN